MNEVLRRHRVTAGLGLVLLMALLFTALISGASKQGALDPDAYDPSGAHALAALLEEGGVTVVRTTDLPSTTAAAVAESTVFVPLPDLLSPEELAALAPLPGHLLIAGLADPTPLGGLATTTELVEPGSRDPSCSLPAATNAGRVSLDGYAYRAGDREGCYPVQNGFLLLDVPAEDLTLLGSPALMTNEDLDSEGNAALSIGLLSRHPKVVWLVPSPTRAGFGTRPLTSPDDLLPDWLKAARWQLLLVIAVLALARGRRLGRVVHERLPVVVRASETVEGHGRLYAVAHSRAIAAEALRESALRRLARLVHGGSTEPASLAALVSARTGWSAGLVQSVLYGPPPADDAALTLLADDLDRLCHAALTPSMTTPTAATTAQQKEATSP